MNTMPRTALKEIGASSPLALNFNETPFGKKPSLKAQNEKNPLTCKIHSSFSRSVFMPIPLQDLDPFQAAVHLLPFILIFTYARNRHKL